MNWKNEKNNLEKLITIDNLSYEEIGRMFNCSGSNIKKVAKRLGINLPCRRKINPKETFNKGTAKVGVCEYCGKEFIIYESSSGKYCSHECCINSKKKQSINDWKNGTITGYDRRYKIISSVREYFLNKAEYKCEKCGFSGYNPYTKKSILQLHHKDGNASNTSEENIEVLCPNCHALTENFGSRNKSSIRKYRKEDYKKREKK